MTVQQMMTSQTWQKATHLLYSAHTGAVNHPEWWILTQWAESWQLQNPDSIHASPRTLFDSRAWRYGCAWQGMGFCKQTCRVGISIGITATGLLPVDSQLHTGRGSSLSNWDLLSCSWKEFLEATMSPPLQSTNHEILSVGESMILVVRLYAL